MPFCRTGFQINLFLPSEAHLLQTLNFFVLSTLEKYHQISRGGPWSATHVLGGITFGKKMRPFDIFEEWLTNRPYKCLQVLFA